MAYKAVIAGASGLVGNELLKILLQEDSYYEVLILVRKPLPIQHKKLVQLVVDFNLLDKYANAINGHALFCCLGSTRKKTPDLAEYRKIDYNYPLQLAQIALQNKVSQYHLMSSLGANSKSSNFYTKMKGEIEQAISRIGLDTVHIYRPSLLTGQRAESRPTERIVSAIMKIVDPLLLGPFKQYRSISANAVAKAMYNQSLNKDKGLFIHPSNHIKKLA